MTSSNSGNKILRRLRGLHPMNNIGVDWKRLPRLDGDGFDDCPSCGEPVYLDLSFPLNQLRCRECGLIGLIESPPESLLNIWRNREEIA